MSTALLPAFALTYATIAMIFMAALALGSCSHDDIAEANGAVAREIGAAK